MAGAFMAFGLGLLYGYGQTFLTYLLDRRAFVGLWMGHLRLLICALATVFFVLSKNIFNPKVFHVVTVLLRCSASVRVRFKWGQRIAIFGLRLVNYNRQVVHFWIHLVNDHTPFDYRSQYCKGS